MKPIEITKILRDTAKGSNFGRLTAHYARDHDLVRTKEYLIKSSGLMSFLWKVDHVYDFIGDDASKLLLDFLYDVYTGYFIDKADENEELKVWLNKHEMEAKKVPFDELLSFVPDNDNF